MPLPCNEPQTDLSPMDANARFFANGVRFFLRVERVCENGEVYVCRLDEGRSSTGRPYRISPRQAQYLGALKIGEIIEADINRGVALVMPSRLRLCGDYRPQQRRAA